jgi:hypothetical protein
MTMVVGMNAGHYVLLMADTRTTFLPPGRPAVWRDGRKKIQQTKLGLIAGAGAIGFLDAVQARLAGEDGNQIGHLDDIRRIIAEQRHTSRPPDGAEVREQKGFAHTAWLLTYLNPKERYEDWLRLAVIEGATGDSWRARRGQVMLLMPTDSDLDATQRLNAVLEEGLRVQENPGDLTDSLNRNIALSALAIEAVADENAEVSRSFQVGVYTRDGLSAVSEIVQHRNDRFSLALTR